MIITKDFIENSFFMDNSLSILWDNMTDSEIAELILVIPVDMKIHFDRFTRIFISLNKRKYLEARIDFEIRDYFTIFKSEIAMRRKEIKSLLTGLIETSSKYKFEAIIDYRNHLTSIYKKFPVSSINGADRFYDSWSEQHQLLLNKLEKVSSMQELCTFNDYFHNILIELFIEMLVIFENGIKYIIDYVMGYADFKEAYASFNADFEKFREDIQTQKEIFSMQ